jgi:predicted nucleotidyltransferase
MLSDIALAREYKRRVVQALDGRVAKVVLYGSRARGDAHADSDWDIAVFLTDGPTPDDLDRLSDLGTDLLYDTGQYVQPMPMPSHRLEEDSSLLKAIRSEGVPL